MLKVYMKIKCPSFKAKLLLSYVLLISIPLAISSVIIYKQFLLSYKEASSTMVVQRINQEVNNINEALDTIESAAFMLSSNITFNTFLNEEYNSSSTDSFNNLVNRVIPMFTWSRGSNPNISKIYAFTYNNSIPEIDMFIHASRYENENWFKIMKAKTRLGLPYWENHHIQRSYRGIQNTSPVSAYSYSLFCTVEPVYEENSTYLEFLINPKLLYSALNLSPVGKSGYLTVLDKHNGIISDKRNPLLTSFVQNKNFSSKLDQMNGEYDYTFDHISYKINYQEIQRLNAYIVSVVPATEITELYNESINSFIYSFAIMLIFLLVLAYYLGNLLTKKIKKIENAFHRFQKGDFETRIAVKGSDELDNLGADFNVMASNINELINKVYKAEIAQKQAEINALQDQIKPHFIYNTLESLKMTAELHDEEEISDGLTALGSLIRQNTYSDDHLIAIDLEVDNLRDYIKIQNLVHNNEIKATINIPEEIKHYSILNLLMQPIVENCIKHGYDGSFDGFEILIECREANNNIFFYIRDNGCGIEKGKLEKLGRRLDKKASDPTDNDGGKSIGLLNVNRRIKLYYGDQYGVQIKSVIGEGTEVIVNIPALMK